MKTETMAKYNKPVAVMDHDDHNYIKACHLLGIPPELMTQFVRCLPELIECVPRLQRCEPQLSRFEKCTTTIDLPTVCGRLEEFTQKCTSFEQLLKNTRCPAQQIYGPVTVDQFSSVTTVDLETPVTGLPLPYKDDFPLPQNRIIRLLDADRPGYCPEAIEIDLALAGNATNYLDVRIQFKVGNTNVGPNYRGSHFVEKDGRLKKIKFPLYRDQVVIIGDSERLTVEITMAGPGSIQSASVTVHVNAAGWYQVCAV